MSIKEEGWEGRREKKRAEMGKNISFSVIKAMSVERAAFRDSMPELLTETGLK